MKKLTTKTICMVLSLLMLLTLVPFSAYAANSEGATIIKEVSISGVATPYAGETPNYESKLGLSDAYTYDDQLADDVDVVEGKWWYDETSKSVVNPDDAFAEGHVYTFAVLLVAKEGYEFRVDNYNTPFIRAYVNGAEATVQEDLTGKKNTMIKYTFEPCEYNYEVATVEVNVAEPVAGGYPTYDVEILTGGVSKDDPESPYYIEGVTWYDCKNQTFLDPSHTFKEDGVYEVNIMLTTIGDYYFATENDKADVKVIINGKEGEAGTAGKNDKYHIHVSCVVYGDVRQEVSYVEVTDVTAPVVGATPDFDVKAEDTFYINGVFWTDITDSKNPVAMKETDAFIADHKYELQVWIRAKDGYKFSTDEDDCVDIAALLGGLQADVAIPGSEIAAELSVIYTPLKGSVVSFVEVIEVNAPVAGETPDYDAFCVTRGCNVSKVEWYDVTEGRGTLMNESDTFEAGGKYEVVVRVEAEGNYVFELDDMGINIAEGTVNGEKAVAYSSYDASFIELGFEFAELEIDPVPSLYMGDANADGKVNIKDATAIQKHIASLIILSETGYVLADVDENGNVNIKDATAIQKHVAGMDTGYNIETDYIV
ncbi:MAG: dockerin type I repeat-containing protein [Ruminococcus sp.]|nr:dockerin type I repeat-containing protein [Ruminococcus sp.]